MSKTERIASWDFHSLSILLWVVLCQNPIAVVAQHGQDEMIATIQDSEKPVQEKPVLVPPVVLGFQTPIITSDNQLDDHVGSLVTIRGEVFVNKNQHILGVKIAAAHSLDHADGYASGILAKLVIGRATKSFQHGGSEGDVQYVLYRDLRGNLAGAKRVSDQPKTETDTSKTKVSGRNGNAEQEKGVRSKKSSEGSANEKASQD